MISFSCLSKIDDSAWLRKAEAVKTNIADFKEKVSDSWFTNFVGIPGDHDDALEKLHFKSFEKVNMEYKRLMLEYLEHGTKGYVLYTIA